MTTFSIRLFPVCHLRIGTRRCPIGSLPAWCRIFLFPATPWRHYTSGRPVNVRTMTEESQRKPHPFFIDSKTIATPCRTCTLINAKKAKGCDDRWEKNREMTRQRRHEMLLEFNCWHLSRCDTTNKLRRGNTIRFVLSPAEKNTELPSERESAEKYDDVLNRFFCSADVANRSSHAKACSDSYCI